MEYPPQIDPQQEIEKINSFIKDTFRKTGKTTAIVAVSGGIDSATSLSLTAKTLKPENVIALHLPSKTTTPINTQHATLAMKQAQIPENNCITINIGSIVQKTWRIIKRYSTSQTTPSKDTPNRKPQIASLTQANQLRLANITARTRMTILYDQAKKHDALVIGTENHSENLLGYYTRFGDEASDLEPIKHLYKTQVIQLAKHLNIPVSIINKKPSADLWPGQTDANELGFTYQHADPILYLNKKGKSETEIIKTGYPKNLVNLVLQVVNQNSFKHLVPYSI